jgi:hypothetical protein
MRMRGNDVGDGFLIIIFPPDRGNASIVYPPLLFFFLSVEFFFVRFLFETPRPGVLAHPFI